MGSKATLWLFSIHPIDRVFYNQLGRGERKTNIYSFSMQDFLKVSSELLHSYVISFTSGALIDILLFSLPQLAIILISNIALTHSFFMDEFYYSRFRIGNRTH